MPTDQAHPVNGDHRPRIVKNKRQPPNVPGPLRSADLSRNVSKVSRLIHPPMLITAGSAERL